MFFLGRSRLNTKCTSIKKIASELIVKNSEILNLLFKIVLNKKPLKVKEMGFWLFVGNAMRSSPKIHLLYLINGFRIVSLCP
ncbi:hypothetical protein GCM10027293_27670 [Pontibacter aydingkolensis]